MTVVDHAETGAAEHDRRLKRFGQGLDFGAGAHSLQIEINRSIYMDEDSYRRGDRFAEIQRHLSGLAERLAEFARDRAR